MSTLILKKLPRRARGPVLRTAQFAAALSLLVWLAAGLPLLSLLGAVTVTYLAALAVPALVWHGLKRAARKAGRPSARRL